MMDKSDLTKLMKFYRESPREFRYATAGYLNLVAKESRDYSEKEIFANMIVRNPKFVKNSLGVQTTGPRPIEQQASYMGSIKRPRFSGWKEQQENKRSDKNITTTDARGGSKGATVKTKNRLKRANKFYKPSQFAGKTLQRRFHYMLRVLVSRGGGEFILTEDMTTKHGRLHKGLFSFRNKQIRQLQLFGKPHKIKNIRWMSNAIKRTQNNPQKLYRLWDSELVRIVNKFKNK